MFPVSEDRAETETRRVPEGPNVRQTEPMTVMGTPPWTIGPVRLATDLQELRGASEVASLALLSHVSGTRPVPVRGSAFHSALGCQW